MWGRSVAFYNEHITQAKRASDASPVAVECSGEVLSAFLKRLYSDRLHFHLAGAIAEPLANLCAKYKLQLLQPSSVG